MNERLITALENAVVELDRKLDSERSRLTKGQKVYLESLQSPFVMEETIAIAVDSVLKQTEALSLRIKDCERLVDLCGDAEETVVKTKPKAKQAATS